MDFLLASFLQLLDVGTLKNRLTVNEGAENMPAYAYEPTMHYLEESGGFVKFTVYVGNPFGGLIVGADMGLDRVRLIAPDYIQEGQNIGGWVSPYDLQFEHFSFHPLAESFDILEHLPGDVLDFIAGIAGIDNATLWYRRTPSTPSPVYPTIPVYDVSPYQIMVPPAIDWYDQGDNITTTNPVFIKKKVDVWPVCEWRSADFFPDGETEGEIDALVLKRPVGFEVLPYPAFYYQNPWNIPQKGWFILAVLHKIAYNQDTGLFERWGLWGWQQPCEQGNYGFVRYISESCYVSHVGWCPFVHYTPTGETHDPGKCIQYMIAALLIGKPFAPETTNPPDNILDVLLPLGKIGMELGRNFSLTVKPPEPFFANGEPFLANGEPFAMR